MGVTDLNRVYSSRTGPERRHVRRHRGHLRRLPAGRAVLHGGHTPSPLSCGPVPAHPGSSTRPTTSSSNRSTIRKRGMAKEEVAAATGRSRNRLRAMQGVRNLCVPAAEVVHRDGREFQPAGVAAPCSRVPTTARGARSARRRARRLHPGVAMNGTRRRGPAAPEKGRASGAIAAGCRALLRVPDHAAERHPGIHGGAAPASRTFLQAETRWPDHFLLGTPPPGNG